MNGPANAGNKACVDSSQLALAIFGAIFGTLALCTGFAFAIWYLVRNHQLDKLLFLGRRMRGNHHQHSSKNKEEADIKTEVDCPCPRNYASVETKPTIGGVKHMSVVLEMESNGRKEAEDDTNLKNANVKAIENEEKKTENANVEGLPMKQNEAEAVKLTPEVESTALSNEVTANDQEPDTDYTDENTEQQKWEQQLPPESTEIVGHLRAMLSAEQFGMLEENRRRLEQERRQLRELGVI